MDVAMIGLLYLAMLDDEESEYTNTNSGHEAEDYTDDDDDIYGDSFGYDSDGPYYDTTDELASPVSSSTDESSNLSSSDHSSMKADGQSGDKLILRLNGVRKRLYTDEVQADVMNCLFCLEPWEMSGEHKIISLKCGHLFGESCIVRWLQENYSECPTCKKRARVSKDIILIQARPVHDRKTFPELQEKIDAINRETVTLTTDLEPLKIELNEVNKLREQLEKEYNSYLDIKPMKKLKIKKGERMLERKTIAESFVKLIYGKRTKRLFVASRRRKVKDVSGGLLVTVYSISNPDDKLSEPIGRIDIPQDVVTISNMYLSLDEMLLIVHDGESRFIFYSIDEHTNAITVEKEKYISLAHSCTFDPYRPHLIYFVQRKGSLTVYDRTFDTMESYILKDTKRFYKNINVSALPISDGLPFGGIFIQMGKFLYIMEYDMEGKLTKHELIMNPYIDRVVLIAYQWDSRHFLIVCENLDILSDHVPLISYCNLIDCDDHFELAVEWRSTNHLDMYDIEKYNPIRPIQMQYGNDIVTICQYTDRYSNDLILFGQTPISCGEIILDNRKLVKSLCLIDDLHIGVLFDDSFYIYQLSI